MIHSMTAFSRIEIKGDWGNAVWEIRSVNQRFLETYFRLPEQFRGIEPLLRERFRKQLNRAPAIGPSGYERNVLKPSQGSIQNLRTRGFALPKL